MRAADAPEIAHPCEQPVTVQLHEAASQRFLFRAKQARRQTSMLSPLPSVIPSSEATLSRAEGTDVIWERVVPNMSTQIAGPGAGSMRALVYRIKVYGCGCLRENHRQRKPGKTQILARGKVGRGTKYCYHRKTAGGRAKVRLPRSMKIRGWPSSILFGRPLDCCDAKRPDHESCNGCSRV